MFHADTTNAAAISSALAEFRLNVQLLIVGLLADSHTIAPPFMPASGELRC